MALDTRTGRRPSFAGLLWRSTIGKKTAMAVSGLVMLLYLVVHMLGNLKIFFGAADFDAYAAWLRTIGEPFLHHEWFLWIARVVLLAAVVVHAVAAYQLSRRDLAARPTKYARPSHGHHPRRGASRRTSFCAAARATQPGRCAGAASSSAFSSSGTCWT